METRLIDWLLTRDPAVARLARKYLLDEETPCVEDGLIRMFLNRFDSATGTWGGGVYGPKWISTFYTMRDLVSLEIDPANPVFRRGVDTLLANMWNLKVFVEDDVCVTAMLLGMLLYARQGAPATHEIADFLLSVQLSDGGWNCRHAHYAQPVASVHTTLSTLEALSEYARGETGACRATLEEAIRRGQAYLLERRLFRRATTGEPIIRRGQAYLLERRLFRRATTGEPIFPHIADFHFPTRWKYDLLRALAYFAATGHPYDPRMREGMDILREKFGRGFLLKGSGYSGKIHFPMETSRAGAMNTLRGLRVLRAYDPALFEEKLHGTIRLPEE